MEKENVHKGHRERMRQEFRNFGFSKWEEHRVLEFMLQMCMPRIDTNEIAHTLINRCGGFANVFKAPKEQLKSVFKVGDVTVDYIQMLGEFVRYYNRSRFDVNRTVLNSDTCKGYMIDLFDGKEREYFYMICLNAANHVLFCDSIFEGSFEAMDVDIPKIMRIAIKSDASYVVLAHNHPSGIAVPSNADIVSTQAIERALFMGGIKLLDHIIVAGNECVSMRDGGYMTSAMGIVPKNM